MQSLGYTRMFFDVVETFQVAQVVEPENNEFSEKLKLSKFKFQLCQVAQVEISIIPRVGVSRGNDIDSKTFRFCPVTV